MREKVTSPIRSERLPSMNWATTFLATPSLSSGRKSWALMLPEMSSATTMSIPSERISSSLCPAWGRARATPSRTSAAQRSRGRRGASLDASVGRAARSGMASGNQNQEPRPVRRRHRSTSRGTAPASTARSPQGLARRIIPLPAPPPQAAPPAGGDASCPERRGTGRRPSARPAAPAPSPRTSPRPSPSSSSRSRRAARAR